MRCLPHGAAGLVKAPSNFPDEKQKERCLEISQEESGNQPCLLCAKEVVVQPINQSEADKNGRTPIRIPKAEERCQEVKVQD